MRQLLQKRRIRVTMKRSRSRLAAALATDATRRAHDRARLRSHLAKSALLDGKRMAADLAEALRRISRMPQR
jgi:predicted O-linked N-acetylglucosamine transferase (SPINDLY family)